MIDREIVSLLIRWYETNRKDLPWRKDHNPYPIWLSEIMLQQTRIEAAIPYYNRFLQQIPTIQDLAVVEDEILLKLWEGLGYYSRAKNLKKTAKILCEKYQGVLPKTVTELKQLPGIGDYTAGAIASIAYGMPEPAVDGNVLRVMMRLLASKEDVTQQKTKKQITQDLREIYPSGQEAQMFTEAIMELGETICIPNGEPKCGSCPVQTYCRAYQENATLQYPVKSPPKARRIEKHTILLLSHQDKYALNQRTEKGLLAGLWEFPNLLGFHSLDEIHIWLQEKELKAKDIQFCGDSKHVFSHVEWEMKGYRIECDQKSQAFQWKTIDEIQKDYAIPTAFRYYRNYIMKKKRKPI